MSGRIGTKPVVRARRTVRIREVNRRLILWQGNGHDDRIGNDHHNREHWHPGKR